MDIIAAHRQGLVEQLNEEVAALAGRPSDHVQRAIVLHHLYDHSRGSHRWALLEARRELRIAKGLDALGQWLDRWGWVAGSRDKAESALDELREALGVAGRARTLAAYRAYRLSSTQALRQEAKADLDAEMLWLLDQCHGARRSAAAMPMEQLEQLAEASDQLAANSTDQDKLDAAWQAIPTGGLKRAARRFLGEKFLARAADRDARRGTHLVERELLCDRALPPAFRANPAQHFYALQQQLRERRRQQWREACDREPDAFELAA